MSRYPEIANLSAAETWIYVREIVALALDSPDQAVAEESENLVESLGPEYEVDPERINRVLRTLNPGPAVEALLSENPGFDLNDPPWEIAANLVSALMDLRAQGRELLNPRAR